jgi:hypothetical protein
LDNIACTTTLEQKEKNFLKKVRIENVPILGILDYDVATTQYIS